MTRTVLHVRPLSEWYHKNHQKHTDAFFPFRINAYLQYLKETADSTQNDIPDADTITDVWLPHDMDSYETFYQGHYYPNLQRYHVNKQNPYYKAEKGMLLSKDGTVFIACPAAAKEAYIPETVTKIKQHAFCNNKNLTELHLPKNIKTLSREIIYDCQNLKEITLPENAEIIHAFVSQQPVINTDSMPHLQHLHLPRHVKEIKTIYSLNCLKEITADAGNPYFSAVDGVLYNKDKTVLVYCPSAKTDITIPDTVQKIAASAFFNHHIPHLKIPASVVSIENGAIFSRITESIELGFHIDFRTWCPLGTNTNLKEIKAGNIHIRNLKELFPFRPDFAPYNDIILEQLVSTLEQMLETKDWSVRVPDKNTKLQAIMTCYAETKDKSLELYLRKHIRACLRLATDSNHTAFVHTAAKNPYIMRHCDIDSRLKEAHEKKRFEIYTELLHYKYTYKNNFNRIFKLLDGF